MNLGGYQNNLGPWNMQRWGSGGAPSWWQGHDPGSWQGGQNNGGGPASTGPGDMWGRLTNEAENKLGMSGAPVATTTQDPGGQGGFDLSHLMHILTGGQGNLSQMFSGGQIPNAQTLFKGMTDGSLQVPSAQNMFQNLMGGVQNGSITPQNMRPNFGNLASYVGGSNTGQPNPAQPQSSPSAFTNIMGTSNG